jgi:hypothetical protein
MSIHLYYRGSSIVIILIISSGDCGEVPRTVGFVLLDLYSTAEFWRETVIIAIILALVLAGISMYAWLAYEYSTTPDHSTRHTVSAVLFGFMAIFGLWSVLWALRTVYSELFSLRNQ